MRGLGLGFKHPPCIPPVEPPDHCLYSARDGLSGGLREPHTAHKVISEEGKSALRGLGHPFPT